MELLLFGFMFMLMICCWSYSIYGCQKRDIRYEATVSMHAEMIPYRY